MVDKSKRPWFRFHLLTMVVMTLAAGGLLGLHVCWPIVIIECDGWSLEIYSERMIPASLFLLAGIALMTESFIRRREARKT